MENTLKIITKNFLGNAVINLWTYILLFQFFVFKNVMFNSMCYLPFRCNYCENILVALSDVFFFKLKCFKALDLLK